MMECTSLVADSDVESLKYSGQNLYQYHFVHRKSHSVRPRAVAVRDQRLTAWEMALPALFLRDCTTTVRFNPAIQSVCFIYEFVCACVF